MSDAIQFLEAMGRAPVEDYAAAVAALDVDPAQREALLQRDAAAIGRLLDGRTRMMLVLAPADDDDDDQSGGEGDDESEEIRLAASAH